MAILIFLSHSFCLVVEMMITAFRHNDAEILSS